MAGPDVLAPPAPSAEIDADVCGSFDRKLDAKLHAAIDAMGDAGTRYGDEHWTGAALKKAIADSGLGCLPFARGAWLVEPADEISVVLDLEITAHLTIRAAVDGRKLDAWSPTVGALHVGYGGMPTTMARQLVTDYDGDGIPELWARTDEDGVEGGHFAGSWILTVHDGKVTEYAPATKLGELGTPIDVDGDGRLDFPVSLATLHEEGDCYGKGNFSPGDFVAHSLKDGTFSTTDAVATQHVKKWCPAAPSQIKTRQDALCARLWAAPVDVRVIRGRIAASCVAWDCKLEIDGKPQKPGATHECNDLLHTFDQKVALTLH